MHAARELFACLANFEAHNSRLWRVSVAVAGAFLCLVGGALIVNAFLANPAYPDHGQADLLLNSDFDLYVRAADGLAGNPYRPELGAGFDRYGYPPLLAGVLAGLKYLLGPSLLGLLWPALCVASLAGAIVLLARGFGAKLGYHWIAVIMGVVLLGRVVRMDIYHGQVNVMILLLFAGGLLLRSQGREIAAAAAFAVMMSLKPFMGAVLIYFMLRGGWRMTVWALGLGAALFAASFLPTWPNIADAALGWGEAQRHFTSPPFVTKPDNQSAYGLFMRMFTETPFSTPWINNPQLVPVAMSLAVASAAILAVLGLHLGKREDEDEETRIGPAPAVLLLECAMVLALLMSCGPLTEGNHMILGFAGLAGALIVGAKRIAARSKHSRLWVVTIIAWLLPALFVVFPKGLWFAYGVEATWVDLSGWEILLSGRGAITLLLAATASAVTLWQERKSDVEVAIPKRPFGKRSSIRQSTAGAARQG